mmetsp:Transcript_19222/g.30023  ORF Transcript_19222/g.30023 Transcript_19222/m.30023 type:complete len:230 (+) Transcript_19222:395-1084(+)
MTFLFFAFSFTLSFLINLCSCSLRIFLLGLIGLVGIREQRRDLREVGGNVVANHTGLSCLSFHNALLVSGTVCGRCARCVVALQKSQHCALSTCKQSNGGPSFCPHMIVAQIRGLQLHSKTLIGYIWARCGDIFLSQRPSGISSVCAPSSPFGVSIVGQNSRNRLSGFASSLFVRSWFPFSQLVRSSFPFFSISRSVGQSFSLSWFTVQILFQFAFCCSVLDFDRSIVS